MNSIVAAISSIFANFVSGAFPSAPMHAVLLGCAIDGDGLVAAGIIIESWPPKNRKEWIALIFVFGGVIMSAFFTIALFVFDEGISGAQQSRIDVQQRTIIALETRLAPRELSLAQQKEIVDFIKPFAGTPFDMSMHVEIEPMRLLGEIEAAMKGGGWIERAPKGGQTFNRGESFVPVGERTMVGVWVLHPGNDSALSKAAKMLIWALRNEGIITSDMTLIKPIDPSLLGAVHVWVGAKP